MVKLTSTEIDAMRAHFLIIGLFSALLAMPAAAQECDPADESQTGMSICADAGYKAADQKLNATYGEIVKRLADDADGKKLLQTSQRAWITFRDAACAFSAGGVEGGSVYPMILSGCLEGLTEIRAEQLGEYLKCEEGDMSCPAPG